MGAHSSLCITLKDARAIYLAVVGDPSELTKKHLVEFFDKVLDRSLYNCVIIEGPYSDDYPDDHGTVHMLTEEYLKDHPADRPDSLTEENQIFRRLLAIRVAGPALYCDDGELQDNSVQPFIDFKRDSARTIQEKIIERGRRKMEAQQLATG